MSIAQLYTDFSLTDPAISGGLGIPDVVDEETQLEVYETGYKAGWEDAVSATQGDTEKATAELAQTLQDMAFTHAEVQAKLMGGLAPALSQITGKLLPKIAMDTFGSQIVEQAETVLRDASSTAVELTMSPDALARLQPQLSTQTDLPFAFGTDPDLSEGQAFLRAGTQEREINLDAVLASVSEAMAAFVDQGQTEKNYG